MVFTPGEFCRGDDCSDMPNSTEGDPPPERRTTRRTGRPRKEKLADPITKTIRVSLELIEKIERYRRWQIRSTGDALPRKELVENAFDEFTRRKFKEPVNLTMLTGGERLVMQRLLRYLVKTPKSDPYRRIATEFLRLIEAWVTLVARLKRLVRMAAQQQEAGTDDAT